MWLTHLHFDSTSSCSPKITSIPPPYMCTGPSVRLRRHHVSRPHNADCSLIVAVCQQQAALYHSPWEEAFLSLSAGSPCASPSSTVSAYFTSSPSWTKTAAGVCHSHAPGSGKCFWILVCGHCSTSAPRAN